MSILINNDTKLIVQGITGKEGAFHTKQMVEYGTQVCAGVTPGKGGQKDDNGIPIFNTVSDAVTETGANVYISSTTDIAGFQFDLASTSDGFSVTDATGGLSEDAAFTVQANASGTVVGFSLTGATIPASDGVLLSLEYDFTGNLYGISVRVFFILTQKSEHWPKVSKSHFFTPKKLPKSGF